MIFFLVDLANALRLYHLSLLVCSKRLGFSFCISCLDVFKLTSPTRWQSGWLSAHRSRLQEPFSLPFHFLESLFKRGKGCSHYHENACSCMLKSITKCLVAVMSTDTEGRRVNAFFVLFFMLLLSLLYYWNKFVSYLLSPWKVKIWVRPKVYIVQYPSTDSDQ